jgi:hypothetical protein
MNNNKLTQLKHYYTEDSLSEEKVDAMWQELSAKLPNRQYHPFHYTARYAVLALIMLVMIGGSSYTVHAAQPNTPLYSLRVLSESVVAKLSGRYDELIETRTDIIINAAQRRSDAEIQQAAEDYQKALDEAKVNQQTTTRDAKESLKETLRNAETKLRSVTPASPKTKSLIRQSIKATQQSQKDVKGATHEEKKPNNNGNENTQDNPANTNPGNGNSQADEHRNKK